MKKFMQRWQIHTNIQLLVILLVFAITGSTSACIAKPILSYFGFATPVIPALAYYSLYILIIFPIYQLLLLLFGSVFGQFAFFYKFEIKMLRSMQLHFIANFLENLKKPNRF